MVEPLVAVVVALPVGEAAGRRSFFVIFDLSLSVFNPQGQVPLILFFRRHWFNLVSAARKNLSFSRAAEPNVMLVTWGMAFISLETGEKYS